MVKIREVCSESGGRAHKGCETAGLSSKSGSLSKPSLCPQTAPMAPSGWNAGRPATVSQAYVTE